jgi:hypothetical protein
VQDISEADAIAEGVRYNGNTIAETGFASSVDAYRALWESLHGKGAWESNPWVWIYTFRQVTA